MAGQQNYLTLSQENYFDNFEKALLSTADLYFLNKRFGIGQDIDKEKLRHVQLYHSILCTDECELIDWVIKKINGELKDNCSLESVNNSIEVKDFKTYNFPYGMGQLNSAVNHHCDWAQIEW